MDPVSLVAVSFGVLVVSGIIFPRSPHGKVMRSMLDQLRSGSDRYRARHAMSAFDASLSRQQEMVAQGVQVSGGNYEALIGKARRTLEACNEDISKVEGRLRVLKADQATASDPRVQRNIAELDRLRTNKVKTEGKLANFTKAREQITGRLMATAEQAREGKERALELEADLLESDMEREAAVSTVGIGGNQSSLKEAEEMVRGQIDRNRGAARMAGDVFGGNSEDAALDMRAQEIASKDTLKEFGF